MAEWHVREGVSHESAPGELFCTVDGGYVEYSDHPDFAAAKAAGYPIAHETRYLPDLNAALHFLVGNKMKFGDTLYFDGHDGAGRELVIDKVMRGHRIVYDVKGVGLPHGLTEIFNPEDLILWLTNVLQPGDIVKYLEN